MLNEDGKTFVNPWRVDGEGRHFRLFMDEGGRMMLCELTGDTTAAEHLTDELICELTRDETAECLNTNELEDRVAVSESVGSSLRKKVRQLHSLISVVDDKRLLAVADAIVDGDTSELSL